jgi:hypothetical protein
MEPIDPKRVRGLLAEAQVTYSAYARVCRLSRVHVGNILSGRTPPGELATFKMNRSLAVLGLLDERPVRQAASA